MAEGRMLKKAISNSRRLAELSSDTARLIYTWIIPHLDVEGRFTADPSIIKGNVFPRIKSINEKIIEKTLKEMNDLDLVTIYKIDGDLYLQVRKFEDHQTGLRKEREAPSKIPAPIPELLQDSSGVILENSGLREEKRREEKYKRSLREEKRSLREEEVKGDEIETENKKISTEHTLEEFRDLFNLTTQYLPKVTELGKGRKEKIKVRFKEGKNNLEWWETVFIKADMILIPGKNGRKDWFPNFDWLIENDKNAVKVFEGNYDDAKRPQALFKPQPGIASFIEKKREKEKNEF